MDSIKYASLWNRYFAAVIDLIICFVIIAILLVAIIQVDIFYTRLVIGRELKNIIPIYHGLFSLILAPFVYFIGFWTKNGQTIGNLLLHIRVLGTNQKSINFKYAIIRYAILIVYGIITVIGVMMITTDHANLFGGNFLLKIAIFSIIFPALVFLTTILDNKRQGFHDKIAKTVVVKS